MRDKSKRRARQLQAPPQDRHRNAFVGWRVMTVSFNEKGSGVSSKILFAGVIVASIAAPLAAQAQGVPGGFAHGVNEGFRIAGPVGAVVGGPVGGVIGGVEGLLGIGPVYQEPPRVYRHRVVRKKARRHVRRTRAQ